MFADAHYSFFYFFSFLITFVLSNLSMFFKNSKTHFCHNGCLYSVLLLNVASEDSSKHVGKILSHSNETTKYTTMLFGFIQTETFFEISCCAFVSKKKYSAFYKTFVIRLKQNVG